jgi:hypothetical protein
MAALLFSGSRSYGFADLPGGTDDRQQGIFNRLMLSREILMRWLMKMNVFHWHCDGMEIEIKSILN